MEIKEKWQSELQSEINFWKGYAEQFRGGRVYEHDIVKGLIDLEGIRQLIQRYAEPVRILDIGCGITSYLYKQDLGKDYYLMCGDALADVYNKLCREKGIIQGILPIKCDFVDVSRVFGEEVFDFVYCQNALDHSYDPLKGIEEMLKSLKVGGTLYMRHHKNVKDCAGEHKGLHLWNFNEQNGVFTIDGGVIKLDKLVVCRNVNNWMEVIVKK